MPLAPSADFYRRYAPMIHRRCLAILGDDEEARDALHDVYLLLVDQLDSFRGESALTTWIYRVATNHCLNRLRSRRVASRVLEAFGRGDREESGHPAEHNDRALLLRRLLENFGERTVQMVIHTYYDEMTQQEIAVVLGISDRAVRKAMKRFLERASELLRDSVERLGEVS